MNTIYRLLSCLICLLNCVQDLHLIGVALIWVVDQKNVINCNKFAIKKQLKVLDHGMMGSLNTDMDNKITVIIA